MNAMINFNFSKLFVAAFAFAAVNTVSAQNGTEIEPCYGDTIYSFNQGPKTNGSPVEDDRSNPELALGMPSMTNAAGSFVSLGEGGSIVIGFDGVALNGPGADLEIYETSFSGDDCGKGDDEFADIYLTADLFIEGFEVAWIPAGQICRDGAIDFEDYELEFITAVKIVNAEETGTFDGYDVDGIRAINGCGPFPVIETGCFGSSALVYTPGSGNISASRSIAEKATGEPERDDSENFVSLGFGGTLILGLDEAGIALPGVDDLELAETSFGNPACGSYTELADVYVSQQILAEGDEIDHSAFVLVGESCTNGESFDVYAETEGWEFFTLVKIVDKSPVVNGRDGFDVDGIVALNGCEELPEPGEDPTPGDCYATDALEYNPVDPIPADRKVADNALGEPERDDSINFASLGFGGSIVLGFDGAAIALPGVNDLEVVETTFGDNDCDSFEERANVYVSQQIIAEGGSVDHTQFLLLGELCTNGGEFDVQAILGWDYFTLVKIVDITPLEAQLSGRDGFDVDGVVALNNTCFEDPNPEIVDPNCTNDEVIAQHAVTGGNVRLTAMGNYQECSGEYGYRWRIRNESGEPRTVFYNFAGAPAMQGPFELEGDEEVYFTTGFGNALNGGGTMRIFVDMVQVDVKAHGGATKNLADCGEGCPQLELPQLQLEESAAATLSSFPNPSKGHVNVTFTPASDELVTIEVIDMSGRTISTLFRQVANAGQDYRLEFDGGSLPNGVYITKMTTNSEVLIQKVMIAR